MTRTILVVGTASHVGKSTVVTGLCRHLADHGVSVAPFKAQNMANNARVVPSSVGDGFGEIGNSQYIQARAARIRPETDMNPVLLKPSGNTTSQLVIHGRAIDHFSPNEYYESHWESARTAAIDAYERLAETYDVIVAEGAGSISEINLHHRDLANRETAAFADADVIVLTDIERGGAFGSLYGNLALAPDEIRDRVQGAIISKFRGDPSLLSSGITTIEEKTTVPVIGVIPYEDPGLPAEDSVSLASDTPTFRGDAGGIPDERTVTIIVPRLPRISNFTDFDPLIETPGVEVAFVPLDCPFPDGDALILPGTKNTVADLRAIRSSEVDTMITAFDGPIIGVCGGYQMLGTEILNATIEDSAAPRVVRGLGMLPVTTTFSKSKRVTQVTRTLTGTGPLDGKTGPVDGFEIHMGNTVHTRPLARPLGPMSAATNRILGTYLHGLFENKNVRDAFLNTVFESAGKHRPDTDDRLHSPYGTVTKLVRDHIDLDALGLPSR